MAVTIVDTVEAQIEKVRDKVETFFETSDQIAGLVKKSSEVETVSRYLYRFAAKQWRGGTNRKVILSDGDMGSGSGMKIASFTAGYIGSARAIRISDEQIETSRTKEQSVVNILQESLAGAILEAQVDDDVAFHGDGTGKLTNAASTGTSTSLTFAASTDTLGVNRLREGMFVDPWDSSGTTKRAGGPYQITDIDYAAKKVTFGSAVTGIATTDLLTIANVDVYGPSAPTSFSSTWPGSKLTGNNGLTGDSYRHGLYYANDATSSNYFLGKQKSALSQLLPHKVDGASSSLTFEHGLQGLDALVQRRDKDVVKGLIGVAHFAQRSKVFALGTAINTKFTTGTSFGKSLDNMPSNRGYDETFDYCGITCYVSKRQFRDRFDFFNPAKWGRAQLHDTKFLENGEKGGYLHRARNSSGNVVSAQELFLVQAFDYVAFDPGAAFYINALTVPAGW